MNFCPNCGSRLLPKTADIGSQVMLVLSSKKCGYKSKEASDDAKLEVKTIQHSPKQMVAVIEKDKDVTVEPTIQMECP